MELGDDIGGMFGDWRSGKSTGFFGVFVFLYRIASDGGVGRDQEIESAIAEDFRETGDLFFIEVGCDFESEWNVFPGLFVEF